MIQTDKGHFWITFDNGYTLSIFNGYGSYSDNHFNNDYAPIYPINKEDIKKYISQRPKSSNCEIAIINPKGKFVTDEILDCDDDVKGYVNVNELIEIINKVKILNGDDVE